MIFSVNLLYVPIAKCRRDYDLNLSTVLVLAFKEPLRSGDFRKRTCFFFLKHEKERAPQEKSDFTIALRLSKCKYQNYAHT